MKTLVAFALFCAISVHAQNQPQTAQPGGGVQPQPFPTGGTQPFQQGVGQPIPGQPFQPGFGQPFGQPFNPYAQFPGTGQFPQPQQPQSLYAVDGPLGKRCVAGLAEYTAIVQNTADYDYSRDLTDCPQAAPNQRTFTAKDIKVYVIYQSGFPQAQCTFDRALFVQMSNNQPVAPGATFGKLFPCPTDGNLDPAAALTNPATGMTGQPTGYAGGYNPYAVNPYGGSPFQPNPYQIQGGFGGYPSFGAGRAGYGVGAAIGASFPGRGPYSAKRK